MLLEEIVKSGRETLCAINWHYEPSYHHVVSLIRSDVGTLAGKYDL